MANTYLTRTFASAGTATKFTLSAWIKRSGISTQQTIMSRYVTANKYVKILINNANQLEYGVYNNNQGGYQARYETSALFRDTSAWYHIVVAQDSSLGTAADRVKFYINGNLVTSFATNTQIGQNVAGDFNNATAHQIGAYNGADFFDGLISHFHFCDNQQYAASTFGSVDSTTGEWKINPSPSVSYGTSGFLILKDGNTITDQSANSNNWSSGGGTLTTTKDCPSNVLATLNPLIKTYGTQVFSNGNTSSINSTNEPAWSHAIATLGASTGKYYWEIKVSGATPWIWTGIISEAVDVRTQYLYNSNAGTFLYGNNGKKYLNASAAENFFATLATNDIVSVALNLDDNKITFYKNGTATPNATPLDLPTNLSSTTVFPATTIVNGASIKSNFGNGFFGTTAITTNSGNGYAGAEGASKFNYQPPSGYSSLSTKGLNQ